MIYLDTSIIVPLFIREAVSDKVHRWLAGIPAEMLVTSEWTKVEFASAIGSNVRFGRVAAPVAQGALQRFREFFENSVTVLNPEPEDFSLASVYIGRFELRLRAGDALHLAVATNHGAGEVCSLDRVLVAAGRRLNLSTRIPI